LLSAAYILFIPANTLPIMQTGSLFGAQRDTILSGVVYLWHSGSWPLALLVFFASIVVPGVKLLALTYLAVSVGRRSAKNQMARAKLYRLLEFIGRWSMLDVYVVTLLSALVQLQSLATIKAEPGAVAFGAVVVLTMLAAMAFDPRLIWDAAEESPGLDSPSPRPPFDAAQGWIPAEGGERPPRLE
jgi:paraquat-inducible protein A